MKKARVILLLSLFSLLTAYQILSVEFYFQEVLTKPFTRVTIQRLLKEDEGVFGFLRLDFPDHIFIISLGEADHMLRLECSSLLYLFSLSVLLLFFSAGGVISERIYRSKTRPHINHSALGFDHIFDHKQNRSTRRQDVTRV